MSFVDRNQGLLRRQPGRWALACFRGGAGGSGCRSGVQYVFTDANGDRDRRADVGFSVPLSIDMQLARLRRIFLKRDTLLTVLDPIIIKQRHIRF